MKSQTPTLAQSISDLLDQNPEILEILHSEFGNISAIAKSIHRRLEETAKRKLSLSATGMALRRFLATTKKKDSRQAQLTIPFEITTRTGIYEVALKRSAGAKKALEKARTTIESLPLSFFSSSEGIYQIVAITTQNNKGIIRKALRKEQILSEIDNMSCVTVNWAPNTKDIPGIYYTVTRALALRDISIQCFDTIGSEMSVYVKESVLTETHQALSRLLLK